MSSYTSGGKPYGRQPHHTKNERLFLLPFCIPHTAAAGECRCGGDAARSSLKCCRVYQRTFQLHRRFLFCIGRTYAPTPKLMSSEIFTFLKSELREVGNLMELRDHYPKYVVSAYFRNPVGSILFSLRSFFARKRGIRFPLFFTIFGANRGKIVGRIPW